MSGKYVMYHPTEGDIHACPSINEYYTYMDEG